MLSVIGWRRRLLQLRVPRYALAFLLAACIFLWPLVLHPDFIPARSGGQESDLLLTHLPNAAYLRQSLSQFQEWPLWNAQILAGQPFAANPLSGMWYPPNLLLLLPWLSLPLAFNLLFILHLAWAGYGVFRLLRAEGLPIGPALFGGVAFTGTPKLIAHLGAGHVSLVFAVAWTPWLLLAIRHMVVEGKAKASTLVGLVLALTFLADVRWCFYAALLGFAFGLVTWRAQPSSAPAARLPARMILGAALLAGLLFLALSAILLVPFLELLHYTNRAALTLDEAGVYSLPPFPYLLGMVLPLYGVIHEWVTYAGIVPLALAAIGLRRRPFWAVAAVVAGAFALGTNFVLFPLLYRWLPGVSLLRVPPRAWFIVCLAICLLAANGLHRLTASGRLRAKAWKVSSMIVPVVLVVTSVDLLWMNASLLTARPFPQLSPAAAWLAAQPGLFRVYSSSGSLALPDALQHVEGVDPLHLQQLADFVARASHITGSGYSVSVPAIFSTDPVNTPAPDARLLGQLNVRYVASAFDLSAPGLTLREHFDATQIYENEAVRPRVWLDGGTATIDQWSPNRIAIQAHGPGLLVLSEVAYPGWQARVEGELVPIETVDGLLRGVHIGPGAHSIVFEFRPWSVYTGALITLLGLIALIGIWLRYP